MLTFTRNVAFLIVSAFSLWAGGQTLDLCRTPNGEDAKCIVIHECPLLMNSVKNGDRNAQEFARQSVCGFWEDHVTTTVCCGTYGTFVDLGKQAEVTGQVDNHFSHQINGFRGKPDRNDMKIQGTIDAVNELHDHRKPVNQHGGNDKQPASGHQQNNCGRHSIISQQLFRGEETHPGEYPWTVLLEYANKAGTHTAFQCSGTLISEEFVLTAAHCIAGNITESYNLIGVRLGEQDIDADLDCFISTEGSEICADDVVNMKISKLIPHPMYDTWKGTNDIALIRLKHTVRYTDFIKPICLPPKHLGYHQEGRIFTYSGWGLETDGQSGSFKRAVNVSVMNTGKCSQKFEALGIRPLTSVEQFCDKIIDGADVCKGVSGGPLMSFSNDEWYQEGIVTFTATCEQNARPGLYTRITKYLPWILDEIRK